MGESLPKKIQNSLNPIDNFFDERKLLWEKNPNFLDSETVHFLWRVENLRNLLLLKNSRIPKFLKSLNPTKIEKMATQKFPLFQWKNQEFLISLNPNNIKEMVTQKFHNSNSNLDILKFLGVIFFDLTLRWASTVFQN